MFGGQSSCSTIVPGATWRGSRTGGSDRETSTEPHVRAMRMANQGDPRDDVGRPPLRGAKTGWAHGPRTAEGLERCAHSKHGVCSVAVRELRAKNRRLLPAVCFLQWLIS